MVRSKKTLRSTSQEAVEEKWVSWHGTRIAGSSMIETDGNFSSLDTPRGADGTKYKSKYKSSSCS